MKATNDNYKRRVDLVLKYIEENLDEKLSLEKLSSIAAFSPYHFHRIFRCITNETLNEYVTRKRIEKAALELLHDKKLISDIAFKYGFEDISSFSRLFKQYYGTSPSVFIVQNPYRHTRVFQIIRKNCQTYPNKKEYLRSMENLEKWCDMKADIQVLELKQKQLAYISCIGEQNLKDTYNDLIKWAKSVDLFDDTTKLITIYYDSFKITEAQKVRMGVCIEINDSITTDGIISKTKILAGKYIVARFVIQIDEFEKSWTSLFLWMNQNGYKQTDSEPFEIFHNDFTKHPNKIATVDLCIPIE
ncbi:AraC family transcriptional regulator [Prolixibacteraceae bacterium]|nr:AraC family transcriptional regulator [Prolixibacteraceae bacterium]